MEDIADVKLTLTDTPANMPRGRVARLELSNPAKLNALSPELILALHIQASRLSEDDSLRAVVLAGAGERAGHPVGSAILPREFPADHCDPRGGCCGRSQPAPSRSYSRIPRRARPAGRGDLGAVDLPMYISPGEPIADLNGRHLKHSIQSCVVTRDRWSSFAPRL